MPDELRLDDSEMAVIEEHEPENESERNDSFVWDEESKLYFHARSGFYHEPNAGWYFSSNDGLYYTYEDGNYVLLESNKVIEDQQVVPERPAEASGEQPCSFEPAHDEEENAQPPSEWLEDTLINLYLMGYPDSKNYGDDTKELRTNIGVIPDSEGFLHAHEDHLSNTDAQLESSRNEGWFAQVEETEIMPEDMLSRPETSSEILDEVTVSDEDNWQAQYGQAGQSVDAIAFGHPVIDLWDWSFVVDSIKGKKHRLVGRLVKKSAKLHPSMASGGGLFKTAAISEVHLDLVRVSSGRIYRLRCPSGAYLASVTRYDSSNPTKNWDFPNLFQAIPDTINHEPCSSFGGIASQIPDQSAGVSLLQSRDEMDMLKKRSHSYRDRAAERRKLHGGAGVGLGHKNDGIESCSASDYSEETSSGSSYTTFASGSYARHILERMGWKEGEALGKTQKGLLEPLQSVGNKGYAGLGWKHDRLRPDVKF